MPVIYIMRQGQSSFQMLNVLHTPANRPTPVDAYFQVPPFKKAFTETMPYVDYLFGNETEAEAFAESEGWNTKNITEIAGKVTLLVLSLNASPVTFVQQGAALNHESQRASSE